MRGYPFAKLSALIVVALLADACGGETDFGGAAGRTADAKPAPQPAPQPQQPAPPSFEGSALSGLTWFWQCEAQPVPTPDPVAADQAVVEGEGPHEFSTDEVSGTKVTFQGKLCEPAAVPRDLVLVIDTSGSMNDNDKRVGNDCGRLLAVKQVIASVTAASGGKDVRIGLATFSSGLDKTSTAMFGTEAELFSNLAPTGNIADVICATNGGTNYDAGMQRAADLLKGGRAGATKEIYFVSDGQPNAGQDGVAIATQLKATGVNIGSDFITATIATVMLAGRDTVMEQQIASRDAAGKPLHAFVANTSGLTKVLTDLTANGIAGGEMKYRPVGTTKYAVLSLAGHIQGFEFTLPSITIDPVAAPSGLEVLFEYWDKHDNRYTSGGKLLWSADGGGG